LSESCGIVVVFRDEVFHGGRSIGERRWRVGQLTQRRTLKPRIAIDATTAKLLGEIGIWADLEEVVEAKTRWWKSH